MRDWALASELQLKNEDATLTESRGMDIAGMSKKMLLCQALGRGRPVFSNPDTWQGDFTQCMKATYANGVFHDPTPPQSPETIRTQCAVGLAHGVNPWVVFVGLSDPTPSAQAVARQMQLAKRWQEESVGAQPYTNVVSIFSTRQRDYLAGGERSLLPPHLEQLRKAQIPTEPLCDRDLPTFDLGPYRAVIAEGAACLTDEEVRTLVDWIKRGGTLLATPDVATCDEIGRRRPSSLLAELLGVTPGGTHPVGFWPSGLVCRRLGRHQGIGAVRETYRPDRAEGLGVGSDGLSAATPGAVLGPCDRPRCGIGQIVAVAAAIARRDRDRPRHHMDRLGREGGADGSGGQPFTRIFAGRRSLLHCEAVCPMTTLVPS